MKPAPFLFALFALLSCLVGIQLSCAGARQRTAAGVAALLDCEAADLPPDTLADATRLATSAVSRWISGSGAIDKAGLLADAQPLKSDLLRCAFAGAVAAASVHVEPAPGAPQSSELVVNLADLRGVMAELRAAGWPAIRVRGAVLGVQ